MGDRSAIEWTEATWNPIVGCSVTSPGCTNCYAMRMAARLERMSQPRYAGLTQPTKAGPVWTGVLRQAPEATLLQPLRWKRPRRIFVNSMSDLFHEDVPDEWIDQVFAVMALAPQHTFQVLTKRTERMRDYVCTRAGDWMLHLPEAFLSIGAFTLSLGFTPVQWPLPNVWCGVSVEDQARADERIPHLLATPAAKRFLSCEPLLGPVNLTDLGGSGSAKSYGAHGFTCLRGLCGRPAVDWVIVGGESGPSARPMYPDWARSLRKQCQVASVPFFFKQWGEFCEWDHGPVTGTIDNDSGLADVITEAAIKPVWVAQDGLYFLDRSHLPFGEPCRLLERLGKHRAGALLDGREWREMPL